MRGDQYRIAAVENASGGAYEGDGVCTSCGARIYWVLTPAGKAAPWDAAFEDDPITHFATCPHAARHRKRNK